MVRIMETIATRPGPIRGSLGRSRESRLAIRSVGPNCPQLSERLDPKPDCVDRASATRYRRYSVVLWGSFYYPVPSSPPFWALPQNLWVRKRDTGSAQARQEGLPSHLHLRSAPVN